MSDTTPNPEHHLVSCPWTAGDSGRDTRSAVIRPPLAADEIVRRQAELGAA